MDSKKKFYISIAAAVLLLPALVLAAGKFDSKLIAKLKGRVLLQVQQHGEAWYVNPADGKRYYMKDGAAAYDVMRKFGQGISDVDLDKIPVGNFDSVTSNSTSCLDELKSRYSNITPGGLLINFNDGVTQAEADALLKANNFSGGAWVIFGSYVTSVGVSVPHGQELQLACAIRQSPIVKSALPYLGQ